MAYMRCFADIYMAVVCRIFCYEYMPWNLDTWYYYVAVKDPIECVILTDTIEGKKETFKLLPKDRINVTMHKNSINYQRKFLLEVLNTYGIIVHKVV